MTRGCILVVDDSEDMRAALEDVLSNESYVPILASNGREALEKLRQVLPNLIITDLVMPELDGIGFLQAVAKNSVYDAIPTIMMTGSDIKEARARLDAGGIRCTVVQKPLNLRDLLELVDEGVRRNLRGRKPRPAPVKVQPLAVRPTRSTPSGDGIEKGSAGGGKA